MKENSRRDESSHKSVRDQRRVLLITDEPLLQFPAMLEAAEIHVAGVCTAIAAPILLRRSRPQLVIASIPFKGMSIQELARMLAQSQDFIPLILVGEDPATTEWRRAAMSAGAFDYFQLPAEVDLTISEGTAIERIASNNGPASRRGRSRSFDRPGKSATLPSCADPRGGKMAALWSAMRAAAARHRPPEICQRHVGPSGRRPVIREIASTLMEASATTILQPGWGAKSFHCYWPGQTTHKPR